MTGIRKYVAESQMCQRSLTTNLTQMICLYVHISNQLPASDYQRSNMKNEVRFYHQLLWVLLNDTKIFCIWMDNLLETIALSFMAFGL